MGRQKKNHALEVFGELRRKSQANVEVRLPAVDEAADVEGAEVLKPYQQRMDKLAGITPKAAEMISRDLSIEDRVGLLCNHMCLSETSMSKLERHIAPAQRTIAYLAIAERLEQAPPELFAAELRKDSLPKETAKPRGADGTPESPKRKRGRRQSLQEFLGFSSGSGSNSDSGSPPKHGNLPRQSPEHPATHRPSLVLHGRRPSVDAAPPISPMLPVRRPAAERKEQGLSFRPGAREGDEGGGLGRGGAAKGKRRVLVLGQSLIEMHKSQVIFSKWMALLAQLQGPTKISAVGLTLGYFTSEEDRKKRFIPHEDGSLAASLMSSLVGTKIKLAPDAARGVKPTPELRECLERVPDKLYAEAKDREALIHRLKADMLHHREVRKGEEAATAAEEGGVPSKSMMVTFADIQAAVKGLR